MKKAFSGSLDLADAMDIPAVGRTQLDKIAEDLQSRDGNCIVVLGHHSPLPTHTQDVRPYATLVDSGQLVFALSAMAVESCFCTVMRTATRPSLAIPRGYNGRGFSGA